MDTLSKPALGLIGRNRPRPLQAPASRTVVLPPLRRSGGLPLMEALATWRSERALASRTLDDQLLADLLWAAAGVNRPAEGGRTAPGAMHARKIDVYAALPTGLYRDEPVLFARTVGVSGLAWGSGAGGRRKSPSA